MAPNTKPETPEIDVKSVAAEVATAEASKVASAVAAEVAANTPSSLLAVSGKDAMTPDEFAAYLIEKLQAGLTAAVAAKAGPVPAFMAQALIGMIVAPIVETLVAIVGHIGMAVPNALGELVERMESKTGWDLNGDGVIGDPDTKNA